MTSPASQDPVAHEGRTLQRPGSVVVVGAGLAGAATVAALRDQGFDGHVTVLGAEGLEPYDRPPLSKELLDRTAPAPLRDEVGADVALADDVRLDDAATGLDLDGPHPAVRTATGVVVADAVVLATGAHAVVPPTWRGARTLHTWRDATGLREALRDGPAGRRLVVVGAGWIGAEVAGVAARAGVDVTVVEAATAPLAAALGPAVGSWTVPWYDAAGVRLLTGVRVAAVEPGQVLLDDGTSLPADVVLVAVGARPSSGWLSGALPLEPDGSLAVDDAFRVLGTDAPVVAVGDLAVRTSPRHGVVPGGHWDGALRGPSVAVRRLLGGVPASADDLTPYVFSTQLGHELALHGHPATDDDVVVRGDVAGAVTALWFRPGTDRLSAVLSVDRPRDVAAARRLFTGPDLPVLDRTRAGDPDVPLKAAVLAG
ncbi:NAD(P)/FAD-dependent oxidoreductase [Cellulomonas carbonis]|nr:FAD-dependent oxidoreductase [Cellulomonas carbonis]GGC16995.1 oxidoreductase [Cellulomonas carbonis]